MRLIARNLDRVLPSLLTAALLALASCDGGAKAGDSETFCTGVIDNLEGLRAIPAGGDDVEHLIRLWRDVGDDAPLAVERDWEIYTDTIELAWTGDDTEEILAMAFASEQSAVAVATWLADNCAIDWGPVTTIVPHGLPTSRVPGSSESPG